MGGIYIHIPFCRQACRYCDFFFTVSLRYQDDFVKSLLLELENRSEEMQNQEMGSIYFGGGTPSLLSARNLDRIMRVVRDKYHISDSAELSIECNPDDLDSSRLNDFLSMGINRLSIGIQSFSDPDLKLMHRSHKASQAYECVTLAGAAGFENISVDLIYGVPGQTGEGWKENIDRALSLPVSHLSAYHLTFEKGTVFDHWRKKGKLSPVAEEQSEVLYRILRDKMLQSGFEHYEISNFARNKQRSRHNQLYWSGFPYLGFGPSAHSYDGVKRSWNASSLKGYMEAVALGLGGESEILTDRERYHDYLITALRTSRGADRTKILQRFGAETLRHFQGQADRFVAEGALLEAGSRLFIDPDRWLLADQIIATMFLD